MPLNCMFLHGAPERVLHYRKIVHIGNYFKAIQTHRGCNDVGSCLTDH